MRLNIPEMEQKVLEFWKETRAFEQSVEQRPENNRFVFYDGPPFATGLPHHGSLLSSVIKDVVPRYKTMRGFRVDRVWGWDCHGLPVENLVEKELGLNSKKDIENLGIDKFNNACKASVLKYDQDWKVYVDRVGRWVDFDNSYKTMDNSYIESVWWGFKQIYDKGLAYEGRHISLYCPRCSTPLSNFEIAMDNSYKDVTDHSTFVKFPVKGEDNTFFLAWTTTPWTLPGNVGLVVDEKAEYVRVKQGDVFYYVAKSLAEKVLGEVEVLETKLGADLVGMHYEPLYPYMSEQEGAQGKKVYEVGAAEFVSLEDGTGIVHTAAMYGEDDFKYAQEHNLPLVPTLDDGGKFLDFVTPFKGLYFKKAEQKVVDDLQERGLLFKDEPYTHSYPFCWRCETALYYNAVPAWFISVKKIKERMVELNEQINWLPEHLKHGRFKHGLESAPDWNVSRNRYWGSPIPVWNCDSCNKVTVIGSVEELKTLSGATEIEDLHLPYIDQYSWKCDSCDGTAKRVTQVFDCWVESGSMPFAAIHYPFENKEAFEQNFPGEFIAEYIAQTRGWFYTLHVLSAAIFDKPSFTNVVTTGTIQAEDGRKMSKSKKNYTDPLELFDKTGADAFRFYLMGSPVMQGENFNFSDKGVVDVMRKVVSLTWNIYTFYAMYAAVGAVKPTESELKAAALTDLDKWLLARWSETLEQATADLDGFNVVRPARNLVDFINDFSTWYLRRSRDRFKGSDLVDKDVALKVTHYVLDELLHVLSPYTPFITEHIYQLLYPNHGQSIHLNFWPEQVAWMKQSQVLEEMKVVRQMVEVALSLRAEAGMKVRQVLEILRITLPSSLKHLSSDMQQLLKDEVNVKQVEVVEKVSAESGYVNKEEYGFAVALKTELSDELLKEGLARDVVRHINNLRKEAGLSIDSRVNVQYQTSSQFIQETIDQYAEQIKKDTLTDALLEMTLSESASKVKFKDEFVLLSIELVA